MLYIKTCNIIHPAHSRGDDTLKNQLTILLIEDDPEECQALIQHAESNEHITLLGATNHANKALTQVKTTIPDVIILDLELHQGSGSGISFLKSLQDTGITSKPYILITTHNISQYTHNQVRQLGADFIMLKSQSDYSAQSVIDFIQSLNLTRQKSTLPVKQNILSPQDAEKQLLTKISSEIDLIGISPKMVGRKYLIDAILLVIDEQKGYIAKIAGKYKKSDASVERAMQNAINQAWRTSDIEDLLQLYTARISSEKGVPTLNEFIFFYANKFGL